MRHRLHDRLPDELTLRPRSPITDEVIESLADEAERGYDVAKIVRRRPAGRAAMAGAPASIESVRLDPELKRDLILRAAAEQVSVSELVRRALYEYVNEG